MIVRKVEIYLAAVAVCVTVWASKPCAGADILYVTNASNSTITKLTPDGVGIVFASDPGTSQVLVDPAGIAVDSAGNVYAANASSTIEKFSTGGVPSRFTSLGIAYGQQMAFDDNGNLFLADSGNGCVDKFTPNGVGTVFADYLKGINAPSGLAIDGHGNIFVSNSGANNIEEFSPSGAGSVFVSGLHGPTGLAFDHEGNLYVADGLRDIEKITPSDAVSLFVSTGAMQPLGLAIDSSDNLYATFPGNNLIEKFAANGNATVFTSSGLSQPAFIAIAIPEPSSSPAHSSSHSFGRASSLSFLKSLVARNVLNSTYQRTTRRRRLPSLSALPQNSTSRIDVSIS